VDQNYDEGTVKMPDGITTAPKRRTKLLAVAPKSAAPSRPKILIFGREGIGKTWFSLQFPSVYFVDTEGGANRDHYTDLLEKAGGVYLGPTEGALDFETVIGQVQALASEKHHYKTLVIDSVTKLFNAAISDEAERLGDKDAFGASKKPAVQYMRRLVTWLMRLDMSVILTCHQKDIWGLSDKGQREVVGAGPDAWEKLSYELDLCINVQKVGPRRIGKIGKSRLLGFPENDTFDFNFETFAEMYGRDVIEADSKPLNLATNEQVAEITRLLGIVKLAEGQEGKWLAAAGAEAWREVDDDKAEKVIAALKAKLV
jgi:AAA domain